MFYCLNQAAFLPDVTAAFYHIFVCFLQLAICWHHTVQLVGACYLSISCLIYCIFFLSAHFTWHTLSYCHQRAWRHMLSFMLESFVQWLLSTMVIFTHSSEMLHSFFYLFFCLYVIVWTFLLQPIYLPITELFASNWWLRWVSLSWFLGSLSESSLHDHMFDLIHQKIKLRIE